MEMFCANVRLRSGKSSVVLPPGAQLMIEQSPTAALHAGSKQDMFHVAANFANRDEYGTLVLDRVGRIISCGAPAENIFGASQVRLTGRWISEFIAGLLVGGSSPSYSARYLVHLSADDEWREFEAKDADGCRFAVEVKLSRMMTDGQEIFLLNVRRSGEVACS
jgi:PAS domain S-box-containing protein